MTKLKKRCSFIKYVYSKPTFRNCVLIKINNRIGLLSYLYKCILMIPSCPLATRFMRFLTCEHERALYFKTIS